jgi:cytochrome aa3-600 menaquinol oxidase subunit 2
VLAQTDKDFNEWVKKVQETAPKLTESEYEELLKPTHLGRLTFSNTHLEWVNHAEIDSKTYTNPELYRYHGYQGKTFEEDDNYKNKNEEIDTDHENHDEGNEDDGGEHHGH